MTALFIKLFNMSVTATWIAIAVILFRLLLRKTPKAIHALAWVLVALRLVCPFSVESVFSLVPSAETVPQDIVYSQTPTIHSGISFFNSTVNPIISENLAPNVADSVNPMQVVLTAVTSLWVIGMAFMLIYAMFSYIRIKKRVKEAAHLEENVWECDSIDTPFIFGIIRPRIYLPSTLKGEDISYVIAHEKAHLKRRDHFWKPFGYLLLTVYWFNPVLWVAYVLLCKDIELATDEKVIKALGEEAKKPYSEALINCSVNKKAIQVCPVAFGESGVKERVKAVLSYKKAPFWIIAAALVSCIVIAVVFLTNPKTDVGGDDSSVSNVGGVSQPENVIVIPSPEKLDKLKTAYPEYFTFEAEDIIDVYIWQGENEDYYCFALKHTEKDLSYDESTLISSRLEASQTVSVIPVEDLKRILVYQLISRDRIRLFPSASPDTYVELEGDAKARAEEAFWKGYGFFVSYNDDFQYLLASAEFDFDGDGVKEDVTMTPGPTSGLYTFVITIRGGYRNTFLAMDYQPDKFVVTEDGCFLECVHYPTDEGLENKLYRISIENGTIVMRCGDEVFGYWGI